MTRQHLQHNGVTPRILAIHPYPRGFGYAVLEGPYFMVDWGLRHVPRDKYGRTMRKAADLMDWYRPDALILEDGSGEGSRRANRIRQLIAALRGAAEQQDIEVALYARARIRTCFSAFSATTKHEIATVIAASFPELEPRLPAKRKIWQSEDSRMAIFDAVSLILTHYCVAEQMWPPRDSTSIPSEA